jgi:hypothetical protein
MAEKGEGATSVTYEKGRLYQLPIADIQPNSNQPRKYFDEEGLAELPLFHGWLARNSPLS